jgi:mRNA interferase RelE/StbE
VAKKLWRGLNSRRSYKQTAIYEIEIMPEAQRGLLALGKVIRRLVGDGIDQLAFDPRPDNSMLLRQPGNLRRLKIGDYRVIYGVSESRQMVTIELVRHRSIVYQTIAAFALTVRSKWYSK